MKKKSKKKQKIDYEKFAYLGIIFIGVGVVFMIAVNNALGIAFIALGIIFMINKIKGKK